MRVGVAGTGSIGRRHIGNLLALGAEVVAMDVSPESLAKAHAEHPHATYLSALPFAGLDALVIATPIPLHLPWVEEAVARKLPFFVEKSIGTIEQLPRWREIAAMELPINQVGYMLRFHDEARLLRESEPTDCELRLRWNAGKYGHRIEESSHEIDLAFYLGASGDVRSHGMEWIEIGGAWVIRIDASSDDYWREWSVYGPRGSRNALFIDPAQLGVEMYHAEMAHFLDCVREQKPTICPLSDGLKVLEVCRQVQEAA